MAVEQIRTWHPACGEEPLVTAEDRAQLPALIAKAEERLVPVDRNDIPATIGYLATAFPSRERDASEDRAKLRHYVDGLSDLPADVLAEACRLAVRECTFMPTVAELRKFAGPALGKHLWLRTVLLRLRGRYDAEPPPRTDLLPPDEAKALLAELAKSIGDAFPSTRAAG